MKWAEVKWPHNPAAPFSDWLCYQANIRGARVILFPGHQPELGWSYTVRGQYSGMLPGVTDLALAKAKLEAEVNP